MQKEKLEFLKEKAAELRKDVITMIYEAQSGHPGGSLSAADFVAALYFSEMKVDPKNPKWPDRDRFVLSKGHACPIQYAALAELGFFDKSVLSTLRKEGSMAFRNLAPDRTGRAVHPLYPVGRLPCAGP